jgi:hypothetical protein
MARNVDETTYGFDRPIRLNGLSPRETGITLTMAT